MTAARFRTTLSGARVLAILRGLDAPAAQRVAHAAARGGIRVLEVTVDSPGALGAIDALARKAELTVGAGTVRSIEQAAAAVDAGAAFLVAPSTDRELIGWAAGARVAVLPGALTPTEIESAWRAGATAVKLFPADSVGPEYLSAIRGPLPDVPLVPTGGVTAANAGAWFGAGATAVAAGGWLTGAPDPSTVTERARALVEASA